MSYGDPILGDLEKHLLEKKPNSFQTYREGETVVYVRKDLFDESVQALLNIVLFHTHRECDMDTMERDLYEAGREAIAKAKDAGVWK